EQGAVRQAFHEPADVEVLQEEPDAGAGRADHRGEFVEGDAGVDVLPLRLLRGEPVGEVEQDRGQTAFALHGDEVLDGAFPQPYARSQMMAPALEGIGVAAQDADDYPAVDAQNPAGGHGRGRFLVHGGHQAERSYDVAAATYVENTFLAAAGAGGEFDAAL